MKVHLIGSETRTICGKGLDEVAYVLTIKEMEKRAPVEPCKTCCKNAKDFQKQ